MKAEPEPSKTEPGTIHEEIESLIKYCRKRADYYLEKHDEDRLSDFNLLKIELRNIKKQYDKDKEYNTPEELNHISLKHFDLRGEIQKKQELEEPHLRIEIFKEIQKKLIAYTGEIGDKNLGVKEKWEELYG